MLLFAAWGFFIASIIVAGMIVAVGIWAAYKIGSKR